MMQSAPKSRRIAANLCYAVATCTMGVAGWFLWFGSTPTPAPEITVVAPPLPSVDEQLRAAREPAAPAIPPTRVTALPPTRAPAAAAPKPAHKPAPNPQHVRGGITIVGPAGITTAVAPATKTDTAPAPANTTTSTLISTLGPNTGQTGPRMYTTQIPAPAPRSTGSASGGLNFYNYDQRPIEAIKRLNRGEDADPKWRKRVNIRPND